MLATRRGLIYFDQINDENILKIYILSLEMDELVTDWTVAINLCSINGFNLHWFSKFAFCIKHAYID